MTREQIEAAQPLALEFENLEAQWNDAPSDSCARDSARRKLLRFISDHSCDIVAGLRSLRSAKDEPSEAEIKAAAEAMLKIAFHGSSHLSYVKEREPNEWDLQMAKAALIAARKARES